MATIYMIKKLIFQSLQYDSPHFTTSVSQNDRIISKNINSSWSHITVSLCLFWPEEKQEVCWHATFHIRSQKDTHTWMHLTSHPHAHKNQASTANSLHISKQILYVRLKERPQWGQRFRHIHWHLIMIINKS